MMKRLAVMAAVGVMAGPVIAEDAPRDVLVPAPSMEEVQRMHRELNERARILHDRLMVAPPAGGRMFDIQFRPGAEEVRKEKAAYLGVMAGPASATLREQLKLPRGIGLAVEFVDKDSPASAAGLAQHDVVTKLDDQWLVSLHQLAVLVRMHKPGDTVKITYIRGGESKTVDVKLVEKEVPVLEEEVRPMRMPLPGPGGFGGPRGDILLPRPDIDGGPGWTPARRVTVHAENGATTRVLSDEEHVITLKVDKEGKKTLSAERVKDKEVVFSGPVDTDEERKKVPAAVAEKLKQLEVGRVTIKADGEGGLVIAGEGPDAKTIHAKGIQVWTVARADDEHTLSLTGTPGDKRLVVKDKAGKVIFDGPVNTEEERKKVPAEVLKKLERMEKAGKGRE